MFFFAALVVCAAAVSDRPACSESGVSYIDNTEKIAPLAFVNSLGCQNACASSPTCKKFTWKFFSPTGACWPISDSDAKAVDNVAAISGPKACKSSELEEDGKTLVAMSILGCAAALCLSSAAYFFLSEKKKKRQVDVNEAQVVAAGEKSLFRPAERVTKAEEPTLLPRSEQSGTSRKKIPSTTRGPKMVYLRLPFRKV